MKKDVKRLLFLLISPLIMFFLMSTAASAADISSLDISIIGDNCIVTGCDDSAQGIMEIPSQISGKSVTVIGEGAFSKCKLLTGVVLPDTVTQIESNAFSNCVNMTDFIMSDNVKTLGQSVFKQCTALKNVELSDELKNIPKDTFYKCSALENITLPENLIFLGENAFYGCANISSILLPEGVVSVAARSFSNCSSLKSVYLPLALTEIGADAFEKCSSLNFVYYGGSQSDFNLISVGSGNDQLEYAEFQSEHNHSTATPVKIFEPTCTTSGYSICLCPCGAELEGGFRSALGHKLTITEAISQADCITDGIFHNKCERCDYFETDTVTKLGHSIVNDKAVEPSCAEKGKTAGSHCSRCGKVVVAQNDIASLGHDFSLRIKDGKHLASRATYKNAAKYYFSCTRCGEISNSKVFDGEKLSIPTVKNVTFTSSEYSVKLGWNKLSNVRGYAVYKKNRNGKITLIKRVRTNSIEIKQLSAGTGYEFAVRAYVLEDSSIVYASGYTSVEVMTKPLPTSRITSKQNDKAITLSWKKSEGATGYRVYRYDTKADKWKIVCTETTKNKLAIKGLESGRIYKLSIRSFIATEKGTVWSKLSDSVSVCTKPGSPVVKATAYKYSIKLEWEKIRFADGYTVYASEEANSGYKKIKTTKKTVCKAEELDSGKYYYFKIYSYRDTSDGRVYSYASQIKKIKTR